MARDNIRNFCIIAHIDHGKSTLSDRMLELTDSVDKRTMTDQVLDNMDIETMKEAVKRTAGRAETECSGNVTKSRLKEISAIGVDYVSCGALTHSAPILDFSLKNLSPIE